MSAAAIRRTGRAPLLAGTALLWAVLQVFNASPLPALLAQWFGINWLYVNSDTERVLHLAFGLSLASMAYPMFKSSSRGSIPWYDWALIIAGLGATLYLIANSAAIADRSGLPTTSDLIASATGLCIVLIATYRALGIPMVAVAAVFLLYVFFGDAEFFPDAMQWKGASFGKAMWHFWMQTEGVFGLALGVSASMVFLFVLFGSLLEKAGAGNYFIKLAFALMGHLTGGPAKAAVAASAATGLISGSSIANTVTTGTFTIPLMKRVGLPAEKAGAVEVASSTNGQLTPPVMGAAAFLMVEYVGIPYLEVIRHAFLPAVISYIALIYIVHLEAEKMGLEGLPRSRSGAHADAETGLLRAGRGRVLRTVPDHLLRAGLAETAARRLLVHSAWSRSFSPRILRWPGGRPPILTWSWMIRMRPSGSCRGPVRSQGRAAYYALPVVVLIWNLMIERKSPGLSAFWATLAMMFVILTQHPVKAFFRGESVSGAAFRRGWRELINGMIAGSRKHDRHCGRDRNRGHHCRHGVADRRAPGHRRVSLKSCPAATCS